MPIFFAVPDSLPEGEPTAAPTASAFETLGAFFGPLGATSGLVGDRLGQGEQPHHMPRGAARSREPATPQLPYASLSAVPVSRSEPRLAQSGDQAAFEPPSDAAGVTGQVGRRAAVDLAFADFGADPLEHDLQTDVARDRVG